jgi:peptidoglycan/LPS O-acetylase OafA/YrhL
MAYPGWIALLPTVSSALLVGIPAGERVRWSPDRLLEAKPLVFMGAVSFVWYLWHWPFFYFGKLMFGEDNLGVSLIAAALSLLAASLTCESQDR